jgi:hypothetical protein
MQPFQKLGRWTLTLVLLGAALPALTPVPAQARSSAWSQGQVVSQTNIATYEPRVAYDPEGFVHVVYFGGPTQSAWDVFYTNNRAGSWAPPRQISDHDPVEQRAPNLAIGRDGRVHVVYEKRIRNNNEVYYVESPDLGKTWGTPVNLSDSSGRAYEPNLAVDATNALHVVWIDSRWADILQTTYSYRPAGGAFSAPIKVGGNTFEQSPDIATSGTTVHVIYQGRRASSNSTKDFDVYYATGSGGSFNPPTNFTRDGDWSLDPTIASDGANALMIAWDTDDNYHDIVASVSLDGGQSWSPRRNIYSRSTAGLTPSLAYGLRAGQGQFHLAWSEGDTGRRSVLYVSYDAARNEWSSEIERASESGTLSVSAAGSLATNETAVAYRNKGLDSTVSTRGVGAFIGAGIEFPTYSGATRERTLGVKLLDPQGDPVEMRYNFDAAPGELDPWLPFAESFEVTAPDVSFCERVFYIQFRTADGRVSPAFSRELLIDDEVQATVLVANPLLATLGGDARYSKTGRVRVSVSDSGECSGFKALTIDGQPYTIDEDGFSEEVPLASTGTLTEGPRLLNLTLSDKLDNQITISRSITVDRTPPRVLSGTLEIAAPPQGLPSVLATLTFTNLVVSDTLYPGGFWGALVANVPASDNPNRRSDSDSNLLTWTPVRLTRASDGSFVVQNWDVLDGITESIADRRYAGDEIEVRVKIVDGAGNVAERRLSATVRLSESFKGRELFLPISQNAVQ